MEAYDQTGLHPYHHAVLAVLDEGSRETQGAIADALGYDRGQLVGLLDELEERGLIERRRDPADRRRHSVRMTPEGKRALGTLRALARRLENDFLANLDETQRAAAPRAAAPACPAASAALRIPEGERAAGGDGRLTPSQGSRAGRVRGRVRARSRAGRGGEASRG